MSKIEKKIDKKQNDSIQFGEHIPEMIKVTSTTIIRGQPILSMQPVIVPSNSTTTSNQANPPSSESSAEQKPNNENSKKS